MFTESVNIVILCNVKSQSSSLKKALSVMFLVLVVSEEKKEKINSFLCLCTKTPYFHNCFIFYLISEKINTDWDQIEFN